MQVAFLIEDTFLSLRVAYFISNCSKVTLIILRRATTFACVGPGEVNVVWMIPVFLTDVKYVVLLINQAYKCVYVCVF